MVVAEPKIRLVLDFSLVRRCHSLRQLASSTSTRRVKNAYERHFHVPVQPLASEPSQTVVRNHHLDRDRVIIVNQIITQSHPILSEACNVFLILDPLCPRSAVGHQFLIQSASESWAQQLGFLQSSNGETNPSHSSGITEAHLPGSDLLRSVIIKIPPHLALAHVPSPVPLTIRNASPPHSSFLHTQPNELCLPYPFSPYAVETAHPKHLANYSLHEATDHVSPGLATFTLACPPAVRLRIRLDPHRVPLDSPCGLRSSLQGLRVSPHNVKLAC